MTKQLESELESLKEENYQLKLKLQNVEGTYRMENEYLKEELTGKDQELKENAEKLLKEFKGKEADFQERISSMNEELQNARDECETLTARVDQLGKTISLYENMESSRSQRAECSEALIMKNEALEAKLSHTESLLEKSQSQILEYSKWRSENDRILRDLREDNECKESCISQLNSRIRQMEMEHQEEAMNFQQILQQRAEDSIDPSKRGNSLFSEVDTRRIKVEDELIRLRKRVKDLTDKNMHLTTKLEQGDRRKEIIITDIQKIIKSEEELMQDMRKIKSEEFSLIEKYKDRLTALREEYTKKLTQYKFNGEEPDSLGELETIRKERDLLIGQRISQDREILQQKREIKILRQQQVQTDSNCQILRMKLEEANEKRQKQNMTLVERANNSADSSYDQSMISMSMTNIRSPSPPSPNQTENHDPNYNNNAKLYQTILEAESPTKKDDDYSSSPESPVLGKIHRPINNKKVGGGAGSGPRKPEDDLNQCNQQ